MKINFDISSKEFYIIRDILQKHLTADYKVWVFGSRAKNQTKYNSDLDIALEHSTIISPMILASLRDDLDDSLLPYKVDIIDINEVANSFKQIINKCKIPFPISLKKNIPQLRFPEFENDGEWEVVPLGSCLDYIQPTKYLVQSTNYESTYSTPVLTAGKTFILGYTDEKEGIFNKNLPVIIFDDFTTASKFVDFPFKTKSSAMKILLANKDINIKFIYESIQIIKYKVKVHQRHWISIFIKLKTVIPKLKEQQKIANFLTAIDNRIKTLEKKKTLLEQYKKGVMQKIFKQELRFKDDNGNEFEGEWSIENIKNIAEVIGGGTPSTYNDEYWNGDINWFTPTEIKDNYVSYSIRKITQLGLEKSSATLLPKGTILLTTRATIGEVSIAEEECTTNQGFQSLVVNSSNSIGFVFNLIKRNKHQLYKRANGSTFLEISKKEIEKIKILIPSLPEQTKIANFLSSIDKKIELTNKKIEHTKAYKKGLLQQMFV